MSEITRGIPEGVAPTAKVINFEATEGRRFEFTQKQSLTRVDAVRPATTPISTEIFTEANQPPQDGKRVEFSAPTGKAGEIRPLAENTHTVIDSQKARENRILNEPDTGVSEYITPHRGIYLFGVLCKITRIGQNIIQSHVLPFALSPRLCESRWTTHQMVDDMLCVKM